jgi:hypothetical protein
LFFRWGLLLLCHQVSWVAKTISLCFYVCSMNINILTTKLFKNMYESMWMYYITEYLIICNILTTYSWWEQIWSQSTVVLKSLSPGLYTGSKTFPYAGHVFNHLRSEYQMPCNPNAVHKVPWPTSECSGSPDESI